MKVRKEEAFMITITINFSSSKVRCGPSMMYWPEIAADFKQRDKISGISSPSYFPVMHGNHCFVLFCLEIAQNTPWWVSGAD